MSRTDGGPVYPIDPIDGTVDTLLMSPDVDPPRERAPKPWERPVPVTPYPADLLQCLCGEHIWIDQQGRRYEHGGFPHDCTPPDGNLSALADEIARFRDRRGDGADRSEKAQDAPTTPPTSDDADDPTRGL